MTFSDLVLKHPGKAICVMGGASSLRKDLEHVTADVYISVNEHGIKVRECDYIVAMDEGHGKLGVPMLAVLRQYSQAPLISHHNQADYVLDTWPGYPRKSLSGMVAVYCAWAMGAKVVVLAGMNAYSGKSTAIRDAKLIDDVVKCPIRGVSESALSKMWGRYDPDEKFGRYVPHVAIPGMLLGVDNKITVIARKPCLFRGRTLKKDDTASGMRHEFRKLLRHQMVVEV